MIKKCTKCEREYPATNEYFIKDSAQKSKLRPDCKGCSSIRRKKYHQLNKDIENAKTLKYKKDNPEIARRSSSKRRALMQNNKYNFYTEAQMLELYGTSCYLCNDTIDLKNNKSCGKPGWETSLWIEHVIPISKGGPDTLANVRPSHGKCNLDKGTKIWYNPAQAGHQSLTN